ncbi:MAG TPA: PAS domain S-box protein, partial [Gemmatimonadaceae bacterium]|nr:PAS domain S-box protein [Gemmatimonadaceae bacterium]
MYLDEREQALSANIERIRSAGDLAAEVARLRDRLEDAEETIRAIREGAVDAFLMGDSENERVYTLIGADRPYRFFVESMQQGALMLGTDGTVLYANKRVAELLRALPDGVTGNPLARFVVPECRPELEEILRRARDADSRGELLMERHDGGHVPVYVTISPIPVEGASALCAIITDLTEQKQYEDLLCAQEALRESEERYRALFEQSAIGMAELDLGSHRLWRTNPAFAALLGYTPAELVGVSHRELVHAEERDENCAAISKALAEGASVYRSERRYVRKDGKTVVADLTISFVRDRDGRPLMGLQAMADVTERHNAEALLKDADRRKDEFLATLAHELRNPLAPMRSAIEILEHRAPSDPQIQWSQAVIDRQIRQMTRLVDDLLDLSRITRDQVVLQRGRVELSAVIRNALETSQPLIDERAHQLVVALPRGPIVLEADETRLTQVFSNLLNNAALYTNEAGRITLTAEADEREVRVTVRDNGTGIPASVLPRIFDMFTQGAGKLAGTRNGLGIGLRLVKRLVEMHGGTVKAESDGPGMGSAFTVRLPRHSGAAPAAPAVRAARASCPPAAAEPRARTRFLLVDDNRDSVDSLRVLLELLGHEVRATYDGTTALEVGADFLPEVVLLDLGMPGLSGYDTC